MIKSQSLTPLFLLREKLNREMKLMSDCHESVSSFLCKVQSTIKNQERKKAGNIHGTKKMGMKSLNVLKHSEKKHPSSVFRSHLSQIKTNTIKMGGFQNHPPNSDHRMMLLTVCVSV